MEFKSQICTTKEQSERLLALGLKKETSDMCMDTIMGYVYTYPCKYIEDTHPNWHLTPLWSLHRLIEMTPTTVPDKSNIIHYLTIDGASISYYYFGEEDWELWKNWSKKELYDNVIDCIEWLIKERHFNKEYLEE